MWFDLRAVLRLFIWLPLRRGYPLLVFLVVCGLGFRALDSLDRIVSAPCPFGLSPMQDLCKGDGNEVEVLRLFIVVASLAIAWASWHFNPSNRNTL